MRSRFAPAFDDYDRATLSALGLSPQLITAAKAWRIICPAFSLEELAIFVKRDSTSEKNAMQSRGLFARSRRIQVRGRVK